MSIPDASQFLGHVAKGLPSEEQRVRIGTIDPFYSSGDPKVQWDGEDLVSTATYKVVDYTPVGGDRIAALRSGKTWLILGKIGGTGVVADPIAFPDLTDTPANYNNAASMAVAVKSTADGLEFVSFPTVHSHSGEGYHFFDNGFSPIQGVTTVNSWETIATNVITNPAVAVQVMTWMGAEYHADVAAGTMIVRFQVSLDAGGTWTTSQSRGSHVPRPGTTPNYNRGSASTQGLVAGTPTGDIHVRTQMLQADGVAGDVKVGDVDVAVHVVRT